MLEQLENNPLARGGAVIGVLVIISAGAYFKLYRPLINEIFDIRASIQSPKGKKVGYQEYRPVTEEERKARQLTLEQMYKKFPPPETMPKQITFSKSLNRFYGQGLLLQHPPPKLMQEIAQTAYQSGISGINLVTVNPSQATLTFPSPGPGIQPIELKSSQIQLTFKSPYQQLAEFLERLSQLPRLVKVTKLVLHSEGEGFGVSLTLVTYHFQKGA